MLKKDQCWRCDTVCKPANLKIPCSKCQVAQYCSNQCKDKDAFRHAVDCEAASLRRPCCCCGENKSSVRLCSSCRQAWYCNQVCQRKSWPSHKVHCQQVAESTKALSVKLRQYYEANKMAPGLGCVYYWGNIPAMDLINLPLNEGCQYSKPMAILTCGVGDPRNVAFTLSQLPDAYQEELTFVLNDICACVLARTVLILYMLFKGGAKVAGSVTQIWYSLRLSEDDYRLLIHTLQDLTHATSLEELTIGKMKMNAAQFRRIMHVWRTWKDLSSRQDDWIKEERRKMFESDPGAKEGIYLYQAEIPKEHQSSASEWFQNGILLSKKSRGILPRENFTLTGTDYQSTHNMGTFTYLLQPCVLPFTSWDYRNIRHQSYSACLLKMYSQYISDVLEKCAHRLATGNIKFQFLLCHCLEINRFLCPDRKYDRITTSNLADYFPVSSLLDACKPFLNVANPFSVIITEFINWCMNTNVRLQIMSKLKSRPHSFVKNVLEDTDSPVIAHSTGLTGFVEYFDHTAEFIKFLRAALLVPDVQAKQSGRRRSWKSLAEHNGLVARNFLRCENRISPARWQLNCRRVTMLNGFDKAVEWIFAPQQ